ncbi:hypothetical protein AB0O47_06125 [Streptomyces noursei]|uniref:hypothetical protein n=1 Tax=Streptomyces noursei TaxID=1971 RepID=UPI00344B7161
MSRRTDRTAARVARRDSLLVLLSRAQRGVVLTAAEAALLRAHVEAEVDDADRYRREAGGQQAAVRREQQRTRAAEAAIEEAEQRATAAEQQLAAVHALLPTDARPHLGLPNAVAYSNGVHDTYDALRAALAQH